MRKCRRFEELAGDRSLHAWQSGNASRGRYGPTERCDGAWMLNAGRTRHPGPSDMTICPGSNIWIRRRDRVVRVARCPESFRAGRTRPRTHWGCRIILTNRLTLSSSLRDITNVSRITIFHKRIINFHMMESIMDTVGGSCGNRDPMAWPPPPEPLWPHGFPLCVGFHLRIFCFHQMETLERVVNRVSRRRISVGRSSLQLPASCNRELSAQAAGVLAAIHESSSRCLTCVSFCQERHC